MGCQLLFTCELQVLLEAGRDWFKKSLNMKQNNINNKDAFSCINGNLSAASYNYFPYITITIFTAFHSDEMRPSHCAENQEEAMQQTLQQPAGPLSRHLQANCADFLLPLPLADSRYQLQHLVHGSQQLGQGLQALQDFPQQQKRLVIRY